MTPQRVRDFFIANGGRSGGVTNVVFQSGKKYYKFTATAVTDNFEIPSNLFNPTTDVVELIHGGNIPLIKDENYTLVGNLVTFIGYSLDINDDIHCLITNTAYSYNALVDTPDLSNIVRYSDSEIGTPIGVNADTLGGQLPSYYGKQSDIDLKANINHTHTEYATTEQFDMATNEIDTILKQKADKQYKIHSINTIGWKRIAQGDCYSCGLFNIYNNYNYAHPNIITVSAIKNFADRTSLIQLNANIGGHNVTPKLRIVHNDNISYLEIYYAQNLMNGLFITLENNTTWTLLDTIQNGNIPDGYYVQELTVVDKGMSINNKQVATTDEVDILGAEHMRNGWGIVSSLKLLNRSGNICSINVILSGGTLTDQTVICNVPANFRPPYNASLKVIWQNASQRELSMVSIKSNGDIIIERIPSITPQYCIIAGSYPI